MLLSVQDTDIKKNNKKNYKGKKKMISVSSLQKGYELEGTVVRVHPYGVFVDVGANRL